MTSRRSRAVARVLAAMLVAAVLIGCEPADDTAPEGVTMQRDGRLLLDGVPAVPQAMDDRLAPYRHARSARFVDWLPAGGGMLISTRFGDTHQLHVVAAPGSAREQLTFFDDPVSAAVVRPRAGSPFGFVFRRDDGGAEDYQLYFMDWQTAQPRLLTDGASRNSLPRWSTSGARYAYASTRRNGRDQDIYVGADDGSSRLVLQRGGTWEVLDWSPDDARLLVVRYFSAAQARLYVLELATGAVQEIWPNPGVNGSLDDAKFARSGNAVFLISDAGGDFARLQLVDIATRSSTVLTDTIPWDVEAFDLSPTGAYAFVANEDGVSKLTLRAGRRDGALALPTLPVGVIGDLRFSPEGDRLAFSVETPRGPSDAYALELATMRLERWTRSELGGLDRSQLVGAERVRLSSFDRESFSAFVYRPRAEEHRGRRPAIVVLHGGPEAQARPDFDARRQFFVDDLGLVVIEPNVRGSTGYGKRFRDLDDGLARESAVRDVGAVLDWIARQPGLDHTRVAVMGASYGGYLTLATMARYGARVRAGVDVVGITNFVTFLGTTAPYRRALRRAEYGDDRDPVVRAFLEGISPLTQADKLVRPLLIAQGANDPRVPRTESEQLVRALRSRDVPVWYLLAEDEGHGFRKQRNRARLDAITALFLERMLLGRAAEEAAPPTARAPSE